MTEEMKQQIIEIIAEVLELELDEVDEQKDFEEDYEADSLRKIEILAKLEKTLHVEIPQEELARITNLASIYEIIEEIKNTQSA